MKSLIISLLIILSVTACQDSSQKKNSVSLMGDYHDGVNPNSLANKSIEKQKDRDNKVEISKISSNTKIH